MTKLFLGGILFYYFIFLIMAQRLKIELKENKKFVKKKFFSVKK